MLRIPHIAYEYRSSKEKNVLFVILWAKRFGVLFFFSPLKSGPFVCLGYQRGKLNRICRKNAQWVKQRRTTYEQASSDENKQNDRLTEGKK